MWHRVFPDNPKTYRSSLSVAFFVRLSIKCFVTSLVLFVLLVSSEEPPSVSLITSGVVGLVMAPVFAYLTFRPPQVRVRDAPMRCRKCHYRLNNVAEPRCPACNTAFDPNQPKTFEGGNRRRNVRTLVLFLVIMIPLLISTAAVMFSFYLTEPDLFFGLLPYVGLAAAVLVAVLVVQIFKALRS